MATTYRKSRIGQAEIETRALRLQPRLRNLLIMVDGKRDAGALQALLAYEPAAALQELLAFGLIEAVQQRATTTAQVSATAAAAATSPATSTLVAGADSLPSTAHRALDGAAFATLRKEAVRALNDTLGPPAESTAISMERARNETELRPLLQRAANMIAALRGPAAGRAFTERFLSKL